MVNKLAKLAGQLVLGSACWNNRGLLGESEIYSSRFSSVGMLHLPNCVYIGDCRPTESMDKQLNPFYSTAHTYFLQLAQQNAKETDVEYTTYYQLLEQINMVLLRREDEIKNQVISLE